MNQPVTYFDRRTQSVMTEDIYGEKFLRWTYETSPGRLCLESLVKRHWFSRWYGWRMSRAASRRKILPFIDKYGISTEEMLDRVEALDSFNDFFYRKLKPSSRPVDPDKHNVVFPADGRHFAIPDLGRETGFFVKGQRFNLPRFFQDHNIAARYDGGTMVLSRLCPVDYHRVHFPVEGDASAPRLINGPLYSVNPIALRRRLDYLWTNKRFHIDLQTSAYGVVAIVLIGATCVGSVRFTYNTDQPEPSVAKGSELGCFAFGGSAVAVFFEKNKIIPADDLLKQNAEGREVYARFGSILGHLTRKNGVHEQ